MREKITYFPKFQKSFFKYAVLGLGGLSVYISIFSYNYRGTHKYIRQMLTAIKEEIDSNTMIVGDFNTSIIPMDKLAR